MTIDEVAALAAVILSIGTNVALYIHLSQTMNSRFDGVERRLEMIEGDTHQMDIRLSKLER